MVDLKQFLKAVVLGLAVLIGTPFLAGFLSIIPASIALMGVTLAQALAAGVVAMVAQLVIEKYWK